MDAYKASLTSDNATLMVEPDSAFFDYLHSPTARTEPAAPGEGPRQPAESTAAGLD
jgi:hypothetical protein